MKKILIIYLAVCVTLIFGCDEDIVETPINAEQLLYTEQAFPGQSGELTEVVFNGDTITCEDFGDLMIWQGDMAIPNNQQKSVNGVGLSNPIMYWPDGELVYSISTDFTKSNELQHAIKN